MSEKMCIDHVERSRAGDSECVLCGEKVGKSEHGVFLGQAHIETVNAICMDCAKRVSSIVSFWEGCFDGNGNSIIDPHHVRTIEEQEAAIYGHWFNLDSELMGVKEQ